MELEEKRPILCNVGIFNCECSNLKATRQLGDYDTDKIVGFFVG